VYFMFGPTLLILGTSNGGGWSSIGTSKVYGGAHMVTNALRYRALHQRSYGQTLFNLLIPLLIEKEHEMKLTVTGNRSLATQFNYVADNGDLATMQISTRMVRPQERRLPSSVSASHYSGCKSSMHRTSR